MADSIPPETIKTFARSICSEAGKYGFGQVDFLRLINEIMDISSDASMQQQTDPARKSDQSSMIHVTEYPLKSDRLRIRQADPDIDMELLNGWMADQYGSHFLLSCATAQPTELKVLLANPQNEVGIVLEASGEPIGAVAFLDIDPIQKRAELRKLIGVSGARGKGYAEEATRLWIQYGGEVLGLEKIYVSTLQTHLRNIQLNESIGFKVEGLLQREVLVSGDRHDVLRMGLCFDEFRASDSSASNE